MDLIDRLFGKKEKSEIRFDELEKWLDLRSGEVSEEVGKSAASLYSEIEDALSEIKKSSELIEDAEPEGRFLRPDRGRGRR